MTEQDRYAALATVLALRDHYAPDTTPLGQTAKGAAQALAECVIGHIPAAVEAGLPVALALQPAAPAQPKPAAEERQPGEELPDDDPFGGGTPGTAKPPELTEDDIPF